MALRDRGRYAGASGQDRDGEGVAVVEELRSALLLAIQRMTGTLGRAEGSASRGELYESMVLAGRTGEL